MVLHKALRELPAPPKGFNPVSPCTTASINCCHQERQCKKVYVARVQGPFPSSNAELAAAASKQPAHVTHQTWDCQDLDEEDAHNEMQRQQPCLEVNVPLDYDAKANHVCAIPQGAAMDLQSALHTTMQRPTTCVPYHKLWIWPCDLHRMCTLFGPELCER